MKISVFIKALLPGCHSLLLSFLLLPSPFPSLLVGLLGAVSTLSLSAWKESFISVFPETIPTLFFPFNGMCWCLPFSPGRSLPPGAEGLQPRQGGRFPPSGPVALLFLLGLSSPSWQRRIFLHMLLRGSKDNFYNLIIFSVLLEAFQKFAFCKAIYLVKMFSIKSFKYTFEIVA